MLVVSIDFFTASLGYIIYTIKYYWKYRVNLYRQCSRLWLFCHIYITLKLFSLYRQVWGLIDIALSARGFLLTGGTKICQLFRAKLGSEVGMRANT